jgi:uncharacterized protein YpmS
MPPSHPAPKRRRRGGWILLGLLAALALAAAWVYREATAVPDFYAEVLAKPPTTVPPKVAADRIERDVLNVQNRLERAEPWRLVLKDEDMNAWMTTDLPTKMPNAVPRDIEDPRIVVRDGAVHIACKHQKLGGGVLSLSLVPSLTDTPNELAVTVQSFSLGRLPLPQKQYLGEVSQAAARAGLSLRWEERDGSSVAMVTLPQQYDKLKDRTVKLESIELEDGQIVIQGKAERTR